MGGVDHQHIDPGANQRLYPLIRVRTGTHRRADAQLAEAVLTRVGERFRFVEVFNGDEALQAKVVVHDENFLDTVLMQQALHLFKRRTLFYRNQFFLLGHDRGNRLFRVGLKADIAARHNADEVARLHHRHTGNAVGAGELDQLRNACGALDRDRIFDHATLELLDPADFLGLFLDGHVLVDNADAAFLSQRNGQTRLGDRIHCRGYQWNIERNIARQARDQRDILGGDLGIAGQEEHIVESEPFVCNSEHVGLLLPNRQESAVSGLPKRASIQTGP